MKKKFNQSGFTLVELMIALVLGLILMMGVIGVFVSNQTTARTTNSLANLQNNISLVFQLMSQDLRSAGFVGCNNAQRVVSNIQVGGAVPVWANWQGGVQGFAPDAAGNASIRLMYGSGVSNSVHTHTSPTFTLNNTPTLRANDIAVVCDDSLSTIFQVSAVAGNTISHAASGLNCSADLGIVFPFECTSSRARVFPLDAMIMRFESVRWHVAPSQRNPNVNALYRETVIAGNVINEEVLSGVASLTFEYQLAGAAFGPVPFNANINMNNVVAINTIVRLNPAAFDNIALSQEQLTIEFLSTIRNRQR